MNLAGLKAYFITQLMVITENLRTELSALDEATLQQILIYGLLALAFFVCAGVLLVLVSLFRRRPQPVEDSFQVSSDLSVLVRDLNTRVSNLTAQCKDEQLYFKQELREIKNLLASIHLSIDGEDFPLKKESQGNLTSV